MFKFLTVMFVSIFIGISGVQAQDGVIGDTYRTFSWCEEEGDMYDLIEQTKEEGDHGYIKYVENTSNTCYDLRARNLYDVNHQSVKYVALTEYLFTDVINDVIITFWTAVDPEGHILYVFLRPSGPEA